MRKLLIIIFLFAAIPVHSQLLKKILINKLAKTMNANVGISANDIVLPDTNNIMFHLSDFKGKMVLLNFWFTECGPCIGEIPSERKVYEKLKSSWDSVVWINISTDKSIDKWKKFLRQNPLPGINLIDTSRPYKTATKLHVEEYPTYILLNKEGSIIGHTIPEASSSPDGIILMYLAMRGDEGVKSGDALKELMNNTSSSKSTLERIVTILGLERKQ